MRAADAGRWVVSLPGWNATMKSTEVYSIVRSALGPWCKQQGFKRTKGGMLGWYRPVGNWFVLFWFQVSLDGWDPYAGSKFIVEFQISDEPRIGSLRAVHRSRLPKYLSDDQLERVRELQNRVIARLEKPKRDYHIFQMPENIVTWYLAKFDAVSKRYTQSNDVWLRYRYAEDVEQWAYFIKGVLENLVPSLVATASQQPLGADSP